MSDSLLRPLAQPEELDPVLAGSHQRLQLLFKHSVTCPISGAAHQGLMRHLREAPDAGVDYWLITVQTARPLSQSVAERTSVRHESPQALLVWQGQVVWHASHWSITADSLAQAIATHRPADVSAVN